MVFDLLIGNFTLIQFEEEQEIFERKVLRRIYGPMTTDSGESCTTTRSNKFSEPHQSPESAEIVVDRTCSKNE
jgi:hypothetical protein